MTAQTDQPLPPQPKPQSNSKLWEVCEVVEGVLLCGATALPTCFTLPGLTCLVSASPELPHLPLPTGLRHLRLDLLDTIQATLEPHLHLVADTIHRVLEEKGRVCVHCVAGVSRSPSLILAYLVKYHSLTLRQAFETLRRARPCVRPNRGFFSQLIDFEKSIRGTASVSMVWNAAAEATIPDVYEPEYRATLSYQLRSCGLK